MRKLLPIITVSSLALFHVSGYVSSVQAASPVILPAVISQEQNPPALMHEPTYGEWNILVGQHYASLNWKKADKLPLTLYITPSKHMISIDVIAKTKAYRELKLPFITLNIKDISIVLNRTQNKHGWVTYSSAVYTQNIDRLIKALESGEPMNLNLSTLTSIPINLQGLQPALMRFENIIRQKQLQAPPPLAPKQDTTVTENNFDIPDGMLPSLVPLYQQAEYYAKKCTSLSSQTLRHSLRYDICTKRNNYLQKMKEQGWCWGSGDPDQHDKDKVWRKCIMTPKGGLTELKGKVKQDFEKAKAISGE